MPTLVVPFRGAQGKSRLGLPTSGARAALVEAMLADVLAACAPVGPTFVVAPVLMDAPGVTSVDDPGRGQGAAVEAGLDAAVVAGASAPFLVLNADLPCVTPRDLFALAGSVPAGGIAVAAAADGTTNALGLASADLFDPLYGPGSAARFAALAESRAVDLPNLIDDVDTVADLERLGARLGAHTRAAAATLRTEAA
ncbi:MAG: NTP transferase domain-containing protein [Actinobacteria bacterium]|nr:NTP transferase domain-containing protein [Actinomycetota bacterium]MBV8395234.1 NTP transferase domain-containing protein [Actinomycetota bacterium]MBV8599343.1 NTP transferase domain-containing protein [Actinomycetota bacterium]